MGSGWLLSREKLPAETRSEHWGLPPGAAVRAASSAFSLSLENKRRLWIWCFCKIYGFFSGRAEHPFKET